MCQLKRNRLRENRLQQHPAEARFSPEAGGRSGTALHVPLGLLCRGRRPLCAATSRPAGAGPGRAGRRFSAPPFRAARPRRAAAARAGRGAGPRRGRARRRRRRREGGSRAAAAPRLRSAWARRGASGGRGERGARHGAGLGLEADVVAVLPVPAGHRALHAGALGAHRLQFNASFHRWNGTVHGLCVHASAHHGNIALL